MSNNVYASYNGSQLGFTVRDFALNQRSFSNNGVSASSIAAGTNGDVYLTAANHIYHYKIDGTLVRDMTFPDKGIIYSSVVVRGDRVYATYTGSQKGVTVRDLSLEQRSFFATGVEANGVAAGPNNDVYIAAGNKILNYSTGGQLIKDMTFPVSSINYTDISVLGNTVFAAYNGSQLGFTIRELDLSQRAFHNIGVNIAGIAAGPNNDVYLTSANKILNYGTNGSLIKDMTFPVSSINYTSVAVIFETTT
ncbi:hypothetical protein G6O69_18150 [Pseudenhygromyxa sp. WMMC2535]|uniref:hypothetical protein n=1 Tax=Pseudenhygromyxa sp. WMMC2535 TaxID=2712867 RepID=UPI00155253F0|nr:hypothetical protein [Pseudenhygromyxa sp. WMMC2535]NVB39772.1 hypothetical protein [Pseudenhygromyxa sp. WMMC2535]